MTQEMKKSEMFNYFREIMKVAENLKSQSPYAEGYLHAMEQAKEIFETIYGKENSND